MEIMPQKTKRVTDISNWEDREGIKGHRTG